MTLSIGFFKKDKYFFAADIRRQSQTKRFFILNILFKNFSPRHKDWRAGAAISDFSPKSAQRSQRRLIFKRFFYRRGRRSLPSILILLRLRHVYCLFIILFFYHRVCRVRREYIFQKDFLTTEHTEVAENIYIFQKDFLTTEHTEVAENIYIFQKDFLTDPVK